MKTYSENKICFILCYQEEKELDECLLYLNMLEIPEGYETELLTVQKEESIVSGYQEAMDYSDARYKVYLDTGTYIINRRFIYDFLRVFQSDSKIAMQGVMGCKKLSKDGVIWHSVRHGNLYYADAADNMSDVVVEKKRMLEVEAVESYLAVTAVDIPWREALFDSVEFAVVSKALEYRRMGYKVVVPPQEKSWTIYKEPARLLADYETDRQNLLKEYKKIFESRKDLRILMPRTNTLFIVSIVTELMEMGHQVTLPKQEIDALEWHEWEQKKVEALLEEGNYDLVVTCDFAISVSEACNSVGIKYLAWVYDSPEISTYHRSAQKKYTYVSAFERAQYERLKKKGLPHLHYHPLAADIDSFGSIAVTDQDVKQYTCDISFVGKLYGVADLDEILEKAPEEVREDFNRAVIAQSCIWDGTSRLSGKLSREVLRYLDEKGIGKLWAEYPEESEYFYEAFVLSRKINELERITVLNRLAEKYRVRLYTLEGQKAVEQLHNIQICPPIDYNAEAPKLFYLSKINLNITSRSIESGLPQRIWDVLAGGGFMLTNYQPEIEEYFRIGKDLEVFHDLDELVDKAGYYLKHEEKRKRIAMNGYNKVRANHRYVHRFKSLLTEIFEEDNRKEQ